MKNHLRENKLFCEQNTEAPSALRAFANPRKPGQKASLTEDHPCNAEILKSCILSYKWSRSQLHPTPDTSKPCHGWGKKHERDSSLRHTLLTVYRLASSPSWSQEPQSSEFSLRWSQTNNIPRHLVKAKTNSLHRNRCSSFASKKYQQIFFRGQWTICS